MFDLQPAIVVMADLVRGVRDDQLDCLTPCEGTSVAKLLNHVDGFCTAFTDAARKTPVEGSAPPVADETRLVPDWRTRIPEQLAELGGAWRHDDAWTGMTQAGGVDLPGDVAAMFALDEVVVHGWDLALATGRPFTCDPPLLEILHGFVAAFVAENPSGTPGLFGPPVGVPEDAPLIDRLIGLTGRDPAGTTAAQPQ